MSTTVAPTEWRCRACNQILGRFEDGALVVRQHARRHGDRPRIIRHLSGRIEQDCHNCGETNALTLADADREPLP